MNKATSTKPLPRRLFKLLQALIIRIIYKQSLQSKSNCIDSIEATFSEMEFIEELNKEPLPDSICNNFNNLLFYESLPHQRNLHKMVNYLYKMKQFKRFISFNRVDNNSLYQICNIADNSFTPQGNYVFKKNDMPDYFYIIIKGEISIRKPNGEEEIEIVRLKSGDYFGDWGLLEEKRRTASAYAYTDAYLVKMTPKGFTHTLMKCLKKAEYDRRLFIKKKIPNINNERLIEQLYKSLVRIMLPKGKALYQKGEIATSIYLIYEGSVQIKNKNSYAPVLYCSSGDFLGLETIENFDNENNHTVYKETVITQEEFNVIFKFSSMFLKTQYKGELALFFRSILQQKNKIINEYSNKKERLERNTKMKFTPIKCENTLTPTMGVIEHLFNPINRKRNDKSRLIIQKSSFIQSPIDCRFNYNLNGSNGNTMRLGSVRNTKNCSFNLSKSIIDKEIKGRNANMRYANNIGVHKSLMNNEEIALKSKSLFSSPSLNKIFDIVKKKVDMNKKRNDSNHINNANKKLGLLRRAQSQAMIEVSRMNISSSTLFFKSLNDFKEDSNNNNNNKRNINGNSNNHSPNNHVFNSGSISLPLVSLKANKFIINL